MLQCFTPIPTNIRLLARIPGDGEYTDHTAYIAQIIVHTTKHPLPLPSLVHWLNKSARTLARMTAADIQLI